MSRPRSCVCGLKASDNGDLLVVNKLDQQDLFVNDTWSMGRVTLNLGVRWDRYRGWMPEQRQIAFTNGPVSVPEQTFPERTFFTWNSIGPRVGITYDLAGDGKTVDQGELRTVLAQPGSRCQRRRQSEPEQQERHLHLDRPQRRPALPVG